MNKRFFHSILSVLLILLDITFLSRAYALDTIPSTVEPGRVGQEITVTSPGPKRASLPAIMARPEQMTFPKEVASIQFVLKGFVFEGNTLYSNEQLLALFSKKVGTTVTLGEIQQFANEITLKYNNAGYLLSQAVLPEQAIANGVIHIKIIEGFVDQVTVQGDVDEHTKTIIKQYGDKIVQKKPLNINQLESALLLANDLPGMQVRSVLTPSKSTPNAADLTLLVIHDVVDNTSYIDYDNRGTRYIGPTRTIVSAYINSMLGSGAATGMRIADSGRWKEMRFFEMEHKQYIGTNGFLFDIDGQFTRTQPGFLLQGTNTIGTNKYVMLSSQYPLIRQRSHNLYLNGGFAYINSFMEQFSLKIYNDNIRTFQLGFSYDSLDSYRGSNQLTGYLTQGINYLGASQPGNFVSRVGAKPSFTKFNLSGGRLQGLFSNYSLMLTGNGQYAFNKMYAYEQIGYGGLPFGDAYDPSEIIADRGIAAKVELRADTTFPFSSMPTEYFVYADGATLWNFDHINQPGRQTGTSTGFGIRATAFKYLNFSVELAKPLDRDVAATAAISGNTHNPRAWRGFFSFTLVG